MKTIVVTGASSGVGKAICQYFAGKGYRVYALSRSKDKLEELSREAFDVPVKSFSCDIRDKQKVVTTLETVIADAGKIDILVNNAGTGGNPVNSSLDNIDTVIDTNLKGTMYCTHAILPHMKKNKTGHIFNIASIAGYDIEPDGNDGLYASSKFGQVAFGESVGKAVRQDGINITTLCPGGIDTPIWNNANPYPFDKEEMIKPGEIAELIDYILQQPKRILFKNVVFVPVVEQW